MKGDRLRVLNALAEGPAATGELALALGLPSKTVSAHLCFLADELGVVKRTGKVREGGGFKPSFIWAVVA